MVREQTGDDGPGLAERATTLKARWERSHAARMLERVKDGNGPVLAGGIAYFSLTSIAAGLVIAVTLSSYLVHTNSAWNEAFYSVLEEAVPGIVSTNGDDGLVEPGALQPQGLTGVVGIVGFLVLFNTATRYLRGLRLGVTTMLGDDVSAADKGKLRDFIALFVLILIVVLTIVLQLLSSRFATVVVSWFGDDLLSEWVIRIPALAVALALDMVFVALAIVVLGAYRGPRRPLLWTLLVVAIGIGALRLAVSLVVGGAAENPVLGSVAAVITILIFVDFVARLILFGAAWLGTAAHTLETEPPVGELEAPARRGRHSVTTARATGFTER